MNPKKELNHNLVVFGWGALFIWWGVAFMIDPITLGMGAMGTGLILLGINAIRVMKSIEPVGSTTNLGISFLAWGVLDEVRLRMGLPIELSFALALFVIGLNIWLTPLLTLHRSE
jgi:hypothetical protein